MAVARTPPQPRKRRCPVAGQSFGMYIICTHHVVFKLCFLEKERKMNKVEVSRLVFFTLIKVERTYRVDLAIE